MKQSVNTFCLAYLCEFPSKPRLTTLRRCPKKWVLGAGLLLALLLAFPTSKLGAQSCENPVPYLVIDLSASPSTSTLVFLGGDDVVDPCCSSQAHQLNCQEVLILMHENAVGIQFTQPTPPVQCAIDVYDLSNGCPISAPTSICDPICTQPVYNPETGNYEIRLSFCKPGNFNETDINFQSIADVEPITISQGQSCETTLMVAGAATIYDWTCTSPISNLNYLNCGAGPGVGITCQNPVFSYTGPQVTDCNGQVVTYCVQQAGTCTFTQASISVTLYPDPASYNAHVDVDCSGEAPVLMAMVDNFPCPDDLAYQWFDSNGDPIQGAQSAKFSPGADNGQTYTVEISSVKATGCPPASASAVAACCSPLITCPASTTIQCGDAAGLLAWLNAYVVEACGDPFSVANDYSLPNCNATTGTTDVSFTLLINNEPVSNCSATLTISDTTAPPVPANGSATVACLSLITTPIPPTVTDVCGGEIVPVGPTVSDVPNTLTCEGTRTYAWTFTDCSNNSSTWRFVYTIEYQDFVVPAGGSSTVACPLATNNVPVPPTVLDNCGNEILPSGPVASAIPTCEGNRTYTWVYTDCEGNSHPWVYTYTVEYQDFVMPAGGSSTVACPLATDNVPVPPTVLDNCGNEILPSGPVASALPSCEGNRTYTWVYQDCEGNIHAWVYTYTVEYEDFVMPANGASTVACPSATNTVPVPPTVLDNCGNAITPSGPVASAIPTCEGNRSYTWVYTDCEGNSHPWIYTYTVEYNDFVMPAGGASTVGCPSATNTVPTPPAVIDNCGNALTPSGPVASAIPVCEGTRTYTWVYTDCEGNSHAWVYTYTVDRTAFAISTPNGSATVDCPNKSDEVPLAPLVLNSCGQMLAPVLLGATPKSDCSGDRLYTFRYTDCSGNSADWHFTYHVVIQDFTIPSSETVSVECPLNAVQPAPPTVVDHCGNLLTPIGPVVSKLTNDGGCEGSRKYEWTYTDCQGHQHTWSKSYNILYTADFFVYPDITVEVGCLSQAQPSIPPTIQDICGQDIVAKLTSTTEDIVAGGCSGWRKYTFTYTDCGGHSHPWSTTYLIDDNEGPLGTCPSSTGGIAAAAVSVGINDLTCIEEVPCPTDFDFSNKVEEMLEAGNYFDACSGTDLVVTLDSWTELWHCEDADGDGVPTFGRTFYFHIADPCGNEYPSLCAVTYQGACQPIETFTQQQWGNPGDEPGNSVAPPTTDLSVITTLLAQGGPLTVGGTSRSLSFTDAQCVVDMLPGIGGPTILANCHQTNCGGCNPAGPAGMKNALAANTAALLLNMRYNMHYNGLTMAEFRGQHLGCVDVHECITSCELGVDCHLKMFDHDNLLYDFPYTLGGLLDMANRVLDGSLQFTPAQEVLYTTVLNQTLINVNNYWNQDAAANSCDPAADAAPQNGDGNKVVINQKDGSGKAGEFSLVPNPASSFVTIKLGGLDGAQDVEVAIFNALGQQVKQYQFEQVSSLSERVDIANLEGGIYFVLVKAGKLRFDKKLVITKD